MFDFKDRVLLVTGAGGEIGGATASYFRSCGARVMMADINEAAVSALARSLDPSGQQVRAQRYGVSESADARALVQACLSQFGRLDFLVPAAAIYKDQLLRSMSDAQWEVTMAVNLSGVFYLVRQAIAAMPASSSIVTLASQSGHTGGSVEHGHYGATKRAIGLSTRTLARELGPAIRGNAVSPGMIGTPMVARALAGKREEFIANTPLKRLGRPEEVASLIAFLCSDASSFITGEATLVTGGLYMGG